MLGLINDLRGVLQVLPRIAQEIKAASDAIEEIIDLLPVEVISFLIPDIGPRDPVPSPVSAPAPAPAPTVTPAPAPAPKTMPDEERIIPLDFGGHYPKPDKPAPPKIFRSKEALEREAAHKAEAEAHMPEIVLALLADTPKHINDLCVASHIPVGKLSAILLQLEFDGKVRRKPGNIYLYRVGHY